MGEDDDPKDKDKKKSKVMDVRLPRSISPIHYHVKLIPFINGNFSIHGYSEMTFDVLEDTKNVTIHINGIITKNETIMVCMCFFLKALSDIKHNNL